MLENDGAGEGMLGLWAREENPFLPKAGEPMELAGLGAGEPCSETVQALSDAGVAIRVSAKATSELKESGLAWLPYMRRDLEHIACFP